MLGLVLEERCMESGFADYQTADGSGGLFTECVGYALSMIGAGMPPHGCVDGGEEACWTV